MTVEALKVSAREHRGKGAARKLRAAGQVPGVMYGEGKDSQPVQLDAAMFDRMMRTGAHHRLLDVTVDDGTSVKALVREIQIHPVSRAVEHVDLQRVSMQKRIHVEVRVVLVGKPEGVRNQGGILEHNLREVEVECLPGDIPEEIEIDVSHLQVGQALHISDLRREGVTILGHPETTVATVSLPAAEKSTAEVEAEAAEAAAAAEGEAAEGEDKDKDKDKAEGDSGGEKGGSS